MRGHDALIAMRQRHRVRPGLVFVDLVDRHSPVTTDWPLWSAQAHIEVTDVESIGRLDLRFLVGLRVLCSGFDADRVQQLHEACLAAGASSVISAVLGGHFDSIKTTAMRCSSAATTEAACG